MEKLKHNNDIEIKLLPNRRFIYANRKQNIVITAEHLATEITVLFPDEYEDYSKRVDFVNSHGKEWTEGLYTPEYKSYKGGFHKTRFHFSLPTEVTTEGELKMQFITYKPDKSMITVPFEVIPIDVLDGVLAFKRNARSNPDLLILSANQSAEALFNSQRAVAKSENAVEIARLADEQSKEAIEAANRTAENLAAEIERATTAESNLQAAIDAENTRAQDAESTLAAALSDEEQARILGDEQNAQAITAESERAQNAENEIAVNLASEISRATQAEEDITAALDAETQRAQDAESTLTASLEAETARATAAEQINAEAIAAETARSVAAENALTNALNDETTARIQGDADNAAAITAEEARATNAEQINATAIQAETTRAQGAESTLQTEIAAEQTRATNAENGLQAAIFSEEARAVNAEAQLAAELSSEITRAKNVEQINETAITAETARATQAEIALGARIDTEVPAALLSAKEYADQVAEQVRIDGTIYIGTVDESELPLTGNTNGDLYWISDFNITQPDHSGSAIWNGKTNRWDYNVDRYKHHDDETIVARQSDGALKVSDTDEINLTPDTADFGGSVNLGFKGLVRTLIRKIRGLFQKSADNAAAITAEAVRAQGAESVLSSDLAAETTRAKTAEQLNVNAIQAETTRATGAENSLSQRITDETARAQVAEQANEAAISAETARALSAESGLSTRITAEETRAKAAEQANAGALTAEISRAMSAESGLAASIMAEETRAKAAEQLIGTGIAAEETRARTAEQALAQSILDNAKKTQADWNETDVSAVTYIHNKPTAMPASDVYAWAKTINKPVYTASEVGAEPAFNKNTAFNKNFGTASGTVCQGNDSRLSDARTPTAHTHTKSQITDFPTSMPASDVSAWAKAASKPTYTASEVGAEPAFSKNTAFNKNFGTTSGTVCEGNDSRLSNSRTPTAHTHGNADLVELAAWAKAASKPTYTASEVGAEPAFSKNTAFNKNFGTTSGTVCDGADSRLSNARTPTAHATSSTTYGAGDASNYGHVKLSSVSGASTLPSGDAALKYNYSTAASDIDLNTYVYEGRFTLYNVPTSITDAANNFPSGWNTGNTNYNTAYLEVRRFYNNIEIHQTLYKRRTTQRWVRVLTGGVWSVWTELDSTTVPVSRGGTGVASFTSGAALVADSSTALGFRSITTTPSSGSTSLLTAGGAYSALANKVDNSQKNLGGSAASAGYTFGAASSANYSSASTAIGYNAQANYYMATAIGNYSEAVECGSALGPYAKATAEGGTALGYSTKANYTFSTAVGSNAATTAANQVQLGASGSTVYYYSIASRSDERDKTEIEDCQQGLEFIKKLKPRQFLWDYREDYYENIEKDDGEIEVVRHERDGSKKRTRKHYGLIAQEVKQVIDETGMDFAGYQDHKISGGEDILSLNYMELIAPMIKAIQEQQVVIETLKKEMEALKKQ